MVRESVAHASSQLCRPCVKGRLCVLLYLKVYIIKIPTERDQGETANHHIIGILCISIITQVIIEILALSLAENGVIFRYNHLRRGDYSERRNFQNSRLALCRCV